MNESIPEEDTGQTSPDTKGDIKPAVQTDTIPPLSPETIQRQNKIIDILDDAEEATKQAGQRKPFKDKDEELLFKVVYALGQMNKRDGTQS